MKYIKWHIILTQDMHVEIRGEQRVTMTCLLPSTSVSILICNPQLVWRQYLKPHYQRFNFHLTTKTWNIVIERFTKALFSPLAKNTLIHKSVSVTSTVMEKKQQAECRWSWRISMRQFYLMIRESNVVPPDYKLTASEFWRIKLLICSFENDMSHDGLW